MGVAAALAVLAGCFSGADDAVRVDAESVARQQRRHHFRQAVYFLDHLDQFQPRQAQQQILTHLNKWFADREPHPTWKLDPMLSRLPSAMRELPEFRTLPELKIRASPYYRGMRGGDVLYLQQAVWARDLTGWITRGELTDLALAEAIERQSEVLDADAMAKLRVAALLFDWTVRNIQLESPSPDDAMAPGVEFEPWEAMQMGRGDFVNRARVFMLLARQAGIDVVLLALPAAGDTETLRPWVAAVHLEGRLYLFDTALGIALPTGDGRGVATLAEARSDAPVLRQLDAGSHIYPITRSDLKTVVALIDVPPQAASQRMKILESRLAAEDRMTLTVAPTPLAKQLRACQGIADARLLDTPYRAIAHLRKTTRDRRKFEHWFEGRWAMQRHTPLLQARLLHFRGEFVGDETAEGAKMRYMESRVSEQRLAQLEQQPALLKQWLGLAVLPRDEAVRADFLAGTRRALTRVRQDASYWLGLLAYDNRQYEAARNDFQVRSLDEHPNGPWTHGARFNLARVCELLGRRNNDDALVRRAVALYRQSEDSPQHLGDLWRATQLEAVCGAESPPAETP